MPGIDFAEVRARVSMREVLRLLSFRPLRGGRNQLRGPCPFACGPSRRAFVAYLESRRYYCFCCRRSGNQLELWAAARQLSIYEAARDLCQRLHIAVPRVDHR